MNDAAAKPDPARARPWHALPLCVMTLALFLLLGGLRTGLDDRIEKNTRHARQAELSAALPETFQGDLFTRRFTLDGDTRLGTAEALEAFPIMQDGRQTGIILAPVLIRGYKGEIALLVGIRRDGVLLGVRTLRHQETPGLGDGIETRHSDWMLGFAGRSLAAPAGERPQDADGGVPERHWALRAEGGDFDQLSGATVTSRAVVEATKRVLQYHGSHRDRLYDGKQRQGED